MFNLRTLVLVSLVALVTAQPGLKAKINQRGIDFLMEIAEQYPIGFSMDDMFLKEKYYDFFLDINVSSLALTAFDAGHVVMDQESTSTNTYIMEMKSSALGFAAEYETKLVDAYEQTQQSDGSLSFLYPNVSVNIVVQLNNDEEKEVTFSLPKCKATVEGDAIDIDTSSTLTNVMKKMLKHVIDKTLAKHIENEICATVISRTLMTTINDFTTSIPNGLTSFMGIKIDLDLYSNPKVKNHSLEVELDGKCYPAGNPDISYSYVRRPLPALQSSTIMAQIAIGQYSLETLLDAVVSVGLLKFDVDPSILALSGTTIDINFFSILVPDILVFMAGKKLGFHVELVEPPAINVGPSQINASGNIDFALVARLPNGTFTQDSADTAVVFTINANISGNVWINENKITGNLSKLNLFFSVKSQSDRIGSVNLQLINAFLPQISQNILLPFINDVLAAGCDIPELFEFKFENANIALLQHAGVLSFDLAQVIPEESGSGYDSDFEDTPESLLQ